MGRTARGEAAVAAKRAESRLPHAERVAALLRDGCRAAARELHLAHVDAELERAEAGATICLSALIAGSEAFVVDRIDRGEG